MQERFLPSDEDLQDVQWIVQVLNLSARYIQSEEVTEQRMTFANRLKNWRLQKGFRSVQLLTDYLEDELSDIPTETTRRLVRIMEYANNPHRQYQDTVLVRTLKGISTVEDLDRFRDHLSRLIDAEE